METLLSSILSFVLLYKYTALFLVVLLASFGVPLPAVAITVAAGAFAGENFLSWYLVLIIAYISNVFGDFGIYWLARIFEEKSLTWPVFRSVFTKKRRLSIASQFSRHPALVIIGSRFIGVTTLAVNILSGIVKISFRKFAIFSLAGEFIATGFYVGIGYVFGSNWEYIFALIEKIGLVVVLILILVMYKPVRKLFSL